MKRMMTDDIRRAYLDFFKSKGHEMVSSDSLVPKDDPTLLFTGAGMNQFKEKFLGRNVTYRRATTSQKCLRTGDLENVGKTSGHHTFFEMLGNFSFGDYFKKEAIEWAWEFLTKVLEIDPQRLWASVYKDDEEAYAIWLDNIRLPKGKIMKFGEKENFWPSEAPSKGPNGPCGPCSEIFYDYGKDVGCGKDSCTPACDCGRFIEIWNLVFTQFDRQPDGSLKPLPNKNIDTGMGLERLASVLQGVRTNFEIDTFKKITESIEKAIDNRPQTVDQRPQTKDQTAKMKAIADHIRAITFTIADGVMPSNEERGYVVRKLIRRAGTYAIDFGMKKPFLYKLVPVVVDVMKAQYPELLEKREDIAMLVKKEEEAFQEVINIQLPKVEEAFRSLRGNADKKRLAELAFNFYDTYGMPYDMLEETAERYGIIIDKDIFESLLERQRRLSRSKSKIKGEIFTETFAKKVEALGLKTEFLGYENLSAESKVLAVMAQGEVVLDKTPFYGESGGQVGDWGKIETASGVMEIEDAKRIGDTIVHIGRMLRGKIVEGEVAQARIDEETRRKIMANHTATHLLQAALKKVLGDHVHQTGSLVDQDHLRFDFTHIKKMEDREIARVEELVNDNIAKAIPVVKKIEDLDEAKASGATALFGEKYGSKVRVVSIDGISKELCGGTHADNTKDIGIFKIMRESSTASGVRRIEAVTGEAAKAWMAEQEESRKLKEKAESDKDQEKKLAQAKLAGEIAKVDSFLKAAKTLANTKIVIELIDGVNIEGLRILSDKIKERATSSVIILANKADDKVAFIISISADMERAGLNAGSMAKDLAKRIDGSGGGRPSFAQGGGKSPSRLQEALGCMFDFLKEKIR